MDLKSFPIEDQRKFIHEAAHAVVAFELGLETDFVRVDLAGELAYRQLSEEEKKEIPAIDYPLLHKLASKYLDLDKKTFGYFQFEFKHAILAYAGYMAEITFLGDINSDKYERSSDQEKFEELIAKISPLFIRCNRDLINEIWNSYPHSPNEELSKTKLTDRSTVFASVAQSKCEQLLSSKDVKNRIFVLANCLVKNKEVYGYEMERLFSEAGGVEGL